MQSMIYIGGNQQIISVICFTSGNYFGKTIQNELFHPCSDVASPHCNYDT